MFTLHPQVLLIVSTIEYEPVVYDGYKFEFWVECIGLFMVSVPFLAIFGVAIYKVIEYGVSAEIQPEKLRN